MAGTRSSPRKAAEKSSPTKSDDAVAGQKRKLDEQTTPKRDRKVSKKQATLEETIGDVKIDDSEMKDQKPSEEPQSEESENEDPKQEKKQEQEQEKKKLEEEEKKKKEKETKEHDAKEQEEDQEKGDEKTNIKDNRDKDDKETTETTNKSGVNGDGAIEQSFQREKKIASNILEKGVVYFFTRNRVGIEDSDSVGDLQRTFFVLRPVPKGTKLGDGALQDLKNSRLLALPKKTFPKSHSDRFMAFVEKANTSIKDLKDNFFSADEYETKTMGTRRTEPVTPVAEGVYAITRTEDATTHLVYSTTIPSELGEVQEDLGIKSQGSFIISVKNPERSGPSSTQLREKPDFPKEYKIQDITETVDHQLTTNRIIDGFRNLAWSEVKPEHLNYPYCQILLIGEDIEKAVEPTKKDQKHDKETLKEELEKLEHEDELRVEHLNGDDSVFDDLKISKEEYSKVPTTW